MRLDHVGIVARNLDEGTAALERLGFRLTSRSYHAGSTVSGGPIEPWGSANHCAMLREGYVEMLGVIDPALHSSAKSLIAKYEGAHIVAFACEDAASTHGELIARDANVNAPISLQREVPFGAEESVTKTARFLNMYADVNIYPEARLIIIQHLTPEIIWQAQLLDHPNGALRLSEVYICAQDPAASQTKLAKLVGTRDDIGKQSVGLESGTLYVMSIQELSDFIPARVTLPIPFVAGFGVEVSDLVATESYLESQSVRITRKDDRIWVHADQVCGTAISFSEIRRTDR